MGPEDGAGRRTFGRRGRSTGGSARPRVADGRQPEEPDADPVAVARGIALRQLTMAPRSRSQLATTLAAKGVDGDVAGQVLDRLTEVGLVDDVAFAGMLVRSKQEGRGLARRALLHELRQKGVDDAVARDAVEDVSDDDERASAQRVVARKLRATRGLDRTVRERRLAGVLARKGYPGGLAHAVVREALDGEEPDGSGP